MKLIDIHVQLPGLYYSEYVLPLLTTQFQHFSSTGKVDELVVEILSKLTIYSTESPALLETMSKLPIIKTESGS